MTRSELIMNGKEIKQLRDAISDINEAVKKGWPCLHGNYLYRLDLYPYKRDLKAAENKRANYYNNKKINQ